MKKDNYSEIVSIYSRSLEILKNYRDSLNNNGVSNTEDFNTAVNDIKIISSWLDAKNANQNFNIYGSGELLRESKVSSRIINELLF